jgi:hypothetical protein
MTALVSRRNSAQLEQRLGPTFGAALIAGAVFLATQVSLGWLVFGQSAWEPFHVLAATALGPDVLTGSNAYDPITVFVASMVLASAAIFYGFCLAYIVAEYDNSRAAEWAGAVFGVALYAINFYGLAAAYPWFAQERSWITLYSHVAFGVALASSYRILSRRKLRRP